MFLRVQAERCRRLAKGTDERSTTALLAMAEEYEARIVVIEKRQAADRIFDASEAG